MLLVYQQTQKYTYKMPSNKMYFAQVTKLQTLGESRHWDRCRCWKCSTTKGTTRHYSVAGAWHEWVNTKWLAFRTGRAHALFYGHRLKPNKSVDSPSLAALHKRWIYKRYVYSTFTVIQNNTPDASKIWSKRNDCSFYLI